MAAQDLTGRAQTGSPAVAQVLNCDEAPWLKALLKEQNQQSKDTNTV